MLARVNTIFWYVWNHAAHPPDLSYCTRYEVWWPWNLLKMFFGLAVRGERKEGKIDKRSYLDYTRVISAASKHWRLTDWLFWSLLKHLGMISISFDMFGSCHFFICIFYENHWFFCLYFVLFTFVYNVKFSNWSMTVQMYKTINKKNKTDS